MNSPFKFLDSYDKQDKEIFFGREREIDELYQKVFESKILLVYGISGTGKTSLINCGLANKFNDSDWLPINIRRGKDINDSLFKSISSNAIIKNKSKSVLKQLQSVYLDHFKPIYLIFDQFEEVFIFGNKTERNELIKTVKEVIESDIQCKFLFVIREEYLAGITEFEREITDILSNRIRIEKMSKQNARQVIEGPCKVHNIKVEENFTEKLLDKFGTESVDIELTYLQVYLDKIYRSASQENVIPSESEESALTFSISLLEKLGDVSDLLGSFLEEQIKQLDDPNAGLAILKSFVSIKGTKRQITEEEVNEFALSIGKKITKTDLKTLLNKFINLRILRDKDESGRYELRHDSLAAKIYEKITLVEKELMEVRQFIENAYQNYQKRRILLESNDLKYISTYESSLYLQRDLSDFLKKCHDYESSKAKVVKRITLISSLVFILMIVIMFKSVFNIYKIDRIESETLDNSNSIYNQELKIKYLLENCSDLDNITPYMQQVLFNEYYALDTSEEASLIIKSREFTTCNSNVMYANFSKDGNCIYSLLYDNSIQVWYTNGKEILQLKPFNNQIINIQLSNNNAYLAVVKKDSTVTVWDFHGQKLFSFKTSYNKRNTKDIVRFTADNKYLVSLSPEREAIIYNLEGEIVQELNLQTSKINSISVTDDNRFIATAASNGQVNLWYFNSNKGKYDLYETLQCHWDTIWSVNFSKNCKYFLTASADSSARTFRFDGRQTWDADDFHDYGNHQRLSKISYAEFSESEREIILTRYDVGKYEIRKYREYKLDLKIDEIDLDKRNCKTGNVFPRSKYYDYIFYTSQVYNLFSDLTFSPVSNYTAIVINDDSDTWLLNLKPHFKIAEFLGNKPVFSPDGKYLLTIQDNKILLNPIDLQFIKQKIEERYFPE